MAVRYAFLAVEDFPQVYKTFLEAFADYHLKVSDVTEQMLFNRAIKNGVDFGSSVGAFDGERMVGVTVIGIDRWGDVKSAYDIGTGIVPDYRGQGLANGMFEYVLPRLRGERVKKFVLEVLQVNEPAIRAYRKTGFEIAREFDCFQLERKKTGFSYDTEAIAELDVQPVGQDILESFDDHLEWRPSWENSFASIRRIPDEVELYGAFVNGECVGLIVYYPLLNWVMTLVVKRGLRRRGIASGLLMRLVNELDPCVESIRLNNVEHSDTGMRTLLEKLGFDMFVSQYEMEFDL
ncbi:MAG: GNAT family N-acetyltransferase [Candidatus Latescibacterota bacterium]|nr:MAG: GNAT family N-acetyltransferase [Candidatus Latescibacterota bacterium]